MKYNPFMITPHRKQPQRRKSCGCNQCNSPINTLTNGMVALGSIAVIGGTTVGIINAFQKV